MTFTHLLDKTDDSFILSFSIFALWCSLSKEKKGKPVKIRRGPATVISHAFCVSILNTVRHTHRKREGQEDKG